MCGLRGRPRSPYPSWPARSFDCDRPLDAGVQSIVERVWAGLQEGDWVSLSRAQHSGIEATVVCDQVVLAGAVVVAVDECDAIAKRGLDVGDRQVSQDNST